MMIVIVLYFQIKQDFVYYLKEQRTKNMNLMAKNSKQSTAEGLFRKRSFDRSASHQTVQTYLTVRPACPTEAPCPRIPPRGCTLASRRVRAQGILSPLPPMCSHQDELREEHEEDNNVHKAHTSTQSTACCSSRATLGIRPKTPSQQGPC